MIGLAIGLELCQQGARVSLLSRNFGEAASHAAAGMLAPQAEQIPPGAMLDLCLQSRDLYAEWSRKLEALTGMETGYWACGILAPTYSDEAAAYPPALLESSHWLDRSAIQQQQPGLSPEVVGGWWYPQDAQVDNRKLTRALWTAAQEAGIRVQEGVTVQEILYQGDRVSGVATSAGEFRADHYILATGAWSQALLPIPVVPRKGQMLSVRVPQGQELPLRQVLFGDIYIVPRQDGQIVIGATSETVGFTSGNTPVGVKSLLDRALRLVPGFQELEIEEIWWGFRPATPDELPLLGSSPYKNLTLATGHYRNGILLTPITAQLIARWVLHQQPEPLLEAFHWSRFQAQQ